MPFFGGGASVDLASPTAIGSTTPNTGAFTTLSFAPSNNTTGFSNTSNSLTGSNAQSLISLSQTWNTTGTPSAILLNITDTASNASSLLLNLQTGGTSRLSVKKDGTLVVRGGGNQTFGIESSTSYWRMGNSGNSNNFIMYLNNFYFANATTTDTDFNIGGIGGSGVGILELRNTGVIRWQGTAFTILQREADGVLAQRNSTNAQTFRIYRTYTDASNYERLGLLTTNTTRYTITSQNAGTGSARSLEVSFYTSASDPTSTDITSGCFSVWKNSGTGTVKLWVNDGGTMQSVALA